MSEDIRVKNFVADLRRVLYLAKILLYNLEWLKNGELCPHYLKNDIKNIENSIKRMFSDMMCNRPDTWEKVYMELNRDELHDLSMLMDCMYGVANVAEITGVIEQSKMAAV